MLRRKTERLLEEYMWSLQKKKSGLGPARITSTQAPQVSNIQTNLLRGHRKAPSICVVRVAVRIDRTFQSSFPRKLGATQQVWRSE